MEPGSLTQEATMAFKLIGNHEFGSAKDSKRLLTDKTVNIKENIAEISQLLQLMRINYQFSRRNTKNYEKG